MNKNLHGSCSRQRDWHNKRMKFYSPFEGGFSREQSISQHRSMIDWLMLRVIGSWLPAELANPSPQLDG
jgi:hypothetical protein